MPFENDESGRGGDDQHRSSLVNKLSAARRFGDFVRGLWSSAETAESPPEDRHDLTSSSASPSHAAVSPLEAVADPTAESESESAGEPEVLAESVPEPTGPPRFAMRVLWAPKAGNDDKEWEDGYASNAARGVVAIADGAGDGIFSKLWADLLLKSFVAQPIPLDDPAAVEPWILMQRRAWMEAIRYPEQRWSIQMKIDRSCGAATFVALQLDPASDSDLDPGQPIGWTAWAVGDACLFHIRAGVLTRSFPISAASDFGTTPYLYQSKPMRPTPTAIVTRGELGPFDLVVFATDAVAQRLLADVESGAPPDWGRFWDLDQEAWRGEIAELRAQNAIVNDDCTLVVIRLPSDSDLPPGESAIEQLQPSVTQAREETAPTEFDTARTEEEPFEKFEETLAHTCESRDESNEFSAEAIRPSDEADEQPSAKEDDRA